MDAKRKLKWTLTAIKQRNATFDYWNLRNKNNLYSKKLNHNIKLRTSLLKIYPELGIETIFLNTRVLYFSYFSILYQFSENQILVTGFWDNRQEPSKLLEHLKNKQA